MLTKYILNNEYLIGKYVEYLFIDVTYKTFTDYPSGAHETIPLSV